MIDVAMAIKVIGPMLIGVCGYFWGRKVGYTRGRCQGCSFLKSIGFDPPAPKVEEFYEKVDIVCNACGLVGMFECAACSPLAECGYLRPGEWKCNCKGTAFCLQWHKEYHEREERI